MRDFWSGGLGSSGRRATRAERELDGQNPDSFSSRLNCVDFTADPMLE
jgi:hypothetical protein